MRHMVLLNRFLLPAVHHGLIHPVGGGMILVVVEVGDDEHGVAGSAARVLFQHPVEISSRVNHAQHLYLGLSASV